MNEENKSRLKFKNGEPDSADLSGGAETILFGEETHRSPNFSADEIILGFEEDWSLNPLTMPRLAGAWRIKRKPLHASIATAGENGSAKHLCKLRNCG